ncbi:Pyruvate dehydrogenase protein X component [Araneus ventricosus]|uniref:Dihydrolipoamide acetyltransferase component of pyruvate dehydrogenase complex n=1 Tax=Araneus ventricosus TaxID=182803 RepID=A0A4Y2MQ65_ARAVE|nr:Pyruvate dehydrogenase protein X component [Araneus ventricosus]
MKYQYAFLHNSVLRLAENAIEIKMPSLSPTMTEGTIVKWLKKEGDTITPGDVLCEIQTDKAVVGLEIEEEGVLSKILVPENTQNVQLGAVIAVLIGEGDAITEKEKPVEMAVESSSGVKTVETPSKPVKREYQVCGPSVKKLLTEYGIKYSDVPSSGPKGNLLKGDVLKFIQDKKLKQIPFKVESKAPKIPDVKLSEDLSHVDIPVSSERRTVAEQLIHSKIAMPHAYMNVDCKIDNVFSFIKKMKQDGLEISLNDFLVKSVATALRKVPEMNVMNLNGQAQPLNSINVSITVANDSGYLSATINNADELTVQLVSEQMNSLASQADGWKLGKEPVGGSFRILNLAMTGISNFSEIIYPPEVAVLTIGTVQYVFEEEMPVQRMKATLSFNNQLISGNEAGSFLNNLKQYLENPLTICLS